MTNMLTPRLFEALTFAFQLHGQEARKDTQVPVLAHLLSVCALVQQDGGDEDEAIAALLHDALEDRPQEASPTELDRLVGQLVRAAA